MDESRIAQVLTEAGRPPELALEQENPLPLPPPEFAAIFRPIMEGLLHGMESRKTLLTLTSYCVSLEVALQQMDTRFVGASSGPLIEKGKVNG